MRTDLVVHNFVRFFRLFQEVVGDESVNVYLFPISCCSFYTRQVDGRIWPASSPWLEIIVSPRFQTPPHLPQRAYFVVVGTCRLGDDFPLHACAATGAFSVLHLCSSSGFLSVKLSVLFAITRNFFTKDTPYFPSRSSWVASMFRNANFCDQAVLHIRRNNSRGMSPATCL